MKKPLVSDRQGLFVVSGRISPCSLSLRVLFRHCRCAAFQLQRSPVRHVHRRGDGALSGHIDAIVELEVDLRVRRPDVAYHLPGYGPRGVRQLGRFLENHTVAALLALIDDLDFIFHVLSPCLRQAPDAMGQTPIMGQSPPPCRLMAVHRCNLKKAGSPQGAGLFQVRETVDGRLSRWPGSSGAAGGGRTG